MKVIYKIVWLIVGALACIRIGYGIGWRERKRKDD
jgi:hypothetical protein